MYMGIDLAASERNATGIALYRLCSFETFTVKSNREILEVVNEFKPKVIAVDAPLSYGEKYRKADLAVKFARPLPLNLPEMRKLMFRGIWLKNELSKRGFKVIESFTNALRKIFKVPAKELGPNSAKNKHEEDAVYLAFLAYLHRYGLTSNRFGMILPRKEAVEAVKAQILAKNGFVGKEIDKNDILAGVDVHYKHGIAIAAAVNEEGKVNIVHEPVNFPYVPGLFSLRELKPAIKALKGIDFDVAVVNASGLAHPRAGLATEIGFLLKKPSIGVTKKLLCGEEKGKFIVWENRVVGMRKSGYYLTLGYACNLKFIETVAGRAVEILKAAHRLAKSY